MYIVMLKGWSSLAGAAGWASNPSVSSALGSVPGMVEMVVGSRVHVCLPNWLWRLKVQMTPRLVAPITRRMFQTRLPEQAEKRTIVSSGGLALQFCDMGFGWRSILPAYPREPAPR